MHMLNEASRQVLTWTTALGSALGFVLSVGQLMAGMLLLLLVPGQLGLVAVQVVPPLLIAVGLVGMPTTAYAAFLALSHRPRSGRMRARLDPLVSALAVCFLVTTFFNVVAACVSFGQVSSARTAAVRRALRTNMHQYHAGGDVKALLDETHQLLRCCGAISYRDWFRLDWSGDAVALVDGGEDAPRSSNAVPFSCCSRESGVPCVQQDLDWDGNRTLYRRGCAAQLAQFGQTVLVMAGLSFLVVALLQLALIVELRLLQTSSRSARRTGRATASSEGWVLWGSDSDQEPLIPSPKTERRSEDQYNKPTMSTQSSASPMPPSTPTDGSRGSSARVSTPKNQRSSSVSSSELRERLRELHRTSARTSTTKPGPDRSTQTKPHRSSR